MSEAVRYSRKPYLIVHREERVRKDVYGSIDDAVVLQAQLMRGEAPSKTVLIAMHPIGAPAYLPIFPQLARAGHHVIACASRYSNGDAALEMENVVLDLAACVRDARERLEYENVVLIGWSGGGSLMAGFQAEAQKPVIKATASGESTPLANAKLLAGDALVLVASHRSRHHLLTGQLDASIIDEFNPDKKDRALDLYDAANPAQPPYSKDFLATYRDAQLRRNRRITSWVKEKLASLKTAGRPHDEHCFVVHGTMADPRWIDPTVDPNGRRPNWTYLGDPRVVNNSAAGLGRYSSLRSWLSQWSFDDAQFDSVGSGPRITVPSLVLTASADDACPPAHTDAMFDALGAKDKQKHQIDAANHYFSGPDGRSQLGEAVEFISAWLEKRGFGI
ncbi:alpha/beta hydrolase [Terricaulis silvestris]|uniref:Alpha/beta hydrolase family protein n=1 Tax=Terricaulis silvestris TaxID=2686094 RepID=A0A6I6MLD9_9CAUL|nr:alpha/beta hydrolase [Terricaulis silvestris]QGZ93794.1 Alpha/beta hydrolase family protein [Terricaulis silvestris]